MSLKRNHRLHCYFLKVLILAFRNFIRPLCALKHLILPLWILKHPAFRFYTRPPPLCARTSYVRARSCASACTCARARVRRGRVTLPGRISSCHVGSSASSQCRAAWGWPCPSFLIHSSGLYKALQRELQNFAVWRAQAKTAGKIENLSV